MNATPQVAPVELDHTVSPGRDQLSPRPAVEPRGRFFLVMSALALAISVVGFIPTFFAPLALGAFHRPPIYYVHGLFFFGWVSFFFIQNWLVAGGRILAHREWGVLGAAIAMGMVFSVLTLNVFEMNHPELAPAGAPGPFIAFVGVSIMVPFCAYVAAGLANVRRPEVHKRFLLLATLSLLGAPIERWPITFLAPHDGSFPPLWITQIGAVTIDLLLVAAMIYDRTRHGRISRIYIFGLAMHPIYLMLNGVAGSTGWLHFANWMKGIAS